LIHKVDGVNYISAYYRVSGLMNLNTVLVCEGNKQILDDIRLAILTAFPDCELITIDSGSKCVQIAQQKSPDLFILGLDSIDISGFELIRKLRRLSDNYIIVLSDKGDDNELMRAMKEGADRYIAKPVRAFELIARIKTLLPN
jgi:DNA-binding response OmpR family regulator